MTTQIYLRDPAGNMLTMFSNFVRCEYARGENKVGFMTLDFDPANINLSIFRTDCRLEPWRSVGGLSPYLDGETVYYVRRWGYTMDSQGRELFRVAAMDANYLLDGPIVAYPAGDAKAKMTNQADDICKDIVRQNIGSTATDTTRSLAAYLTVAADLSLAPSISREFSHRIVSSVLQDVCAESFQQGTYLCYDTVYTSPTMLEFRTYTGQRGINHGRASGQTVVISRERQNFEEPSYFEDHENEKNFVYAGGKDVGAARVIKTATNAAAVGLSPFNRRELWIDARNTSTDAAVQAEANSALQDNRYRKTLTGKIIDTEGCRDGVHFRYGDIVYAEYRGQGFDAHINMLNVVIEGGRETRINQIRAEA
jgi:hypothetical protein